MSKADEIKYSILKKYVNEINAMYKCGCWINWISAKNLALLKKKGKRSVNLCPSDIFGIEKIDKEKEVEECNFGNTSCTKCWGNAIKLIGKGEE